MPIPDYQSLMLPSLKFLSDKEEHKTREAVEKLSDDFNLSKEERQEVFKWWRMSNK
jgi:restriction system protein